MTSPIEFGDSLSSFREHGIPIDSPRLRIAHLSDLHFVTHPILRRFSFGGMRGHDRAVITSLPAFLKGMGVDLLFVTGDLSTWGDRKSLRDALSFIERLARSLRLKNERVYMVPGNHDVLIDYYRVSLKSRNFTRVCGNVPMSRIIGLKGNDVGIFSFDSTLRTGVWPFTSNRGQVTPEAFRHFNEADAILPDEVSIKIVQIHHHPLPIPYKLDNGVAGVLTTMTNGATFADRMQECGVHLVMHGHEHFPYSVRVQYHPESNAMIVVSAGTASQVLNHEMSFNYLVITPKSGIALKRYVYRETGFYEDRNATRVYSF